jgi:ribosomal protein S18 acetylase RimI-like enzyme
MTVRLARPTDAAAIARVQVASWHAAYRDLIPATRLATYTIEARTLAWRRNLGVPGGPRTTVFVEDGGVRGFASAGRCRDADGAGELWALYVHPDAWGRGAGSALIGDALAALGARGFRLALVWVLAGNGRALGFYEGCGFRRDGGEKTEDELAQVRLRRPL